MLSAHFELQKSLQSILHNMHVQHCVELGCKLRQSSNSSSSEYFWYLILPEKKLFYFLKEYKEKNHIATSCTVDKKSWTNISQEKIIEESVTIRKNHGRICHKQKKIMEESVIRINFMDESVTRKDHGRICNKKTKSWKNMQHEEKFM